MTNKPDDVTYDMEKLETEAQAFMDKYKLRMKDLSDEILGQLYCKVMPYLETDTWLNYRESLRLELEHEYQFSSFKKDWATRFRRAVFVENREEISKLIEADILKRIKHLEDCRQEYDIFRYSPGGDRYQDIVRERDSLKAEVEKHRLRQMGAQVDPTPEAFEALSKELDELKVEAQKDLNDMRIFQARFIEADHKLIELKAEAEKLADGYEELIKTCEWYATNGLQHERNHFFAVEARGNYGIALAEFRAKFPEEKQ